MPNPKNYDNQKDWMSACVPVRIQEGDKQEQAVAVCLSMWRERNKEMEEESQAMALWNHVKGLFRKDLPNPPHPFMLWKDDETDEYRWLAIYSNKWRDDDNPPEILASDAHRDFVKAVDSGDWPMPELWLWHIPGSKFGVADFVAYDDSGFSLASGSVDKDKEYLAEPLSQCNDLAMSHGMPVKEIERDTEDSTIITRYRSIEVSPLPREKAANKYGTGFEILTEAKMAIPEEKRPELEKMLGGADRLAQFEASLADKAKELDELEIESKDSDEAAEEVEQVAGPVEEVGDEIEAEPKEESTPVEEPPQYVTAEEVAEAVGAYLKPLVEQVGQLAEAFQAQTEEIKELKKGGDERLKEELANTPAASLFDRIGSVIGSKETEIDGRTKLAKAGPEEMTDPSNGPTKVGIINELMAQTWGQR